MSAKNITYPLLFEGGEDKSNVDFCKHTADQEGCDSKCTFQKFPTKEEIEKLTKEEKKQLKKDRLGFIRKTYGILLGQLITTAVIVGAATVQGEDSSLGQAITNQKVWVSAALMAIIGIVAMYCGSTPSKGEDKTGKPLPGTPIHLVVGVNYAVLAIITISVSIVVAKIALMVPDKQVVFEAACLTAAGVFGVTLFALTKFKQIEGVEEFSKVAPMLSAAGVVFATAGIIIFAFSGDATAGEGSNAKLNVLFATIGVLLFVLIMLFDTSMIVGGSNMMYQLGPECYMIGALQLYLEIVNMFCLLIVILGEMQ